MIGNGVELNQLLAALRERPPEDVYLNEPADDDALARMQADAMRHLGRAVPGEYELLLRVTNGVQINGAYFKSAEDLVPENIDVAMPEIIVLGNRGNIDHLVYDHRDQRYATINMGFRDERFAVFERFADLLVEVMRLEDVRLGCRLRRRR